MVEAEAVDDGQLVYLAAREHLSSSSKIRGERDNDPLVGVKVFHPQLTHRNGGDMDAFCFSALVKTDPSGFCNAVWSFTYSTFLASNLGLMTLM